MLTMRKVSKGGIGLMGTLYYFNYSIQMSPRVRFLFCRGIPSAAESWPDTCKPHISADSVPGLLSQSLSLLSRIGRNRSLSQALPGFVGTGSTLDSRTSLGWHLRQNSNPTCRSKRPGQISRRKARGLCGLWERCQYRLPLICLWAAALAPSKTRAAVKPVVHIIVLPKI